MMQQERFIVRTAVAADCAAIAAVQIKSYRTAYATFFPSSYFAGFSIAEQEQDWRDLLAAQAGETLLVAVTPEREILGYLLTKAASTDFPGYEAEIVALHVVQPWQGRGVGRVLLRTAVHALAQQGHKAAMLWTLRGNPIRVWYDRLGGALLGEMRYEVDGWDVEEVAYGWADLAALQAALDQKASEHYA
jgi:GNAT superfamily N-acetyltransferase